MSIALLIVTAAMAWVSAILFVSWACGEWSHRAYLRSIEQRLGRPDQSDSFWERTSNQLAESKVQEAVSLFRKGCACSRVLLNTYGSALGVNRGEALEAGLRFAKEMNASETCGAVTAAFTILAVHSRRTCPHAKNSELLARNRIAEFSRRFGGRYGTTACRELRMRAAESGVLPKQPGSTQTSPICGEVIHDASEILEDLLRPVPSTDEHHVKLAA